MILLEKIVLHPKLENTHREEVSQWCKLCLPYDVWTLKSNYTEHGCFNITVVGEYAQNFSTAFLIKYPETIIVDSKYKITYETAPAAFELFEGLA